MTDLPPITPSPPSGVSPVLPSPADVDRFLERFAAWAETRGDVRVALLIGSRARTDHPADEWSDVDLLLLVEDPDRLLSDTSWIDDLGDPVLMYLEGMPGGVGVERRVVFSDGLDVDFAVFRAESAMEFVRSPLAADVLARGVRVLADKKGVVPFVAEAAARPVPREPPPSAAEFSNLLHDTFHHFLWEAKKLRRGELGVVMGCHSHLTNRLGILSGWHARAVRGTDLDTWHRGRFFEEWADPRVIDRLGSVFPRYDPDDCRRAIHVAYHLFRWLAQETAARLGYPYPADAEAFTTRLLESYLPDPPPVASATASALELFERCGRCGSGEMRRPSGKCLECGECGFRVYFNASTAVMAILCNERGEVYLIRRAKEPRKGKLSLPGGFVDPGESAEAALAREVREEIGVDIRDPVFLASFPNQYEYAGVVYDTCDLVFVCEADIASSAERDGPIGFAASDEVTEVVFDNPSAIDPGDLAFVTTRQALDALLRHEAARRGGKG